jgi:hypothetical protein
MSTVLILPFSISTLSIKGVYVTLSINDTLNVTLSITILRHYAECNCAQCRVLFIMVNVIMLSVTYTPFMLNAIMLSVVMLREAINVVLLNVVLLNGLC